MATIGLLFVSPPFLVLLSVCNWEWYGHDYLKTLTKLAVLRHEALERNKGCHKYSVALA